MVASDLGCEHIHSQRELYPLVRSSTGRKRRSRRFKKGKNEHHDCSLSSSAGQWEGEALQAEEDGEWTLLCVEEQNLSHIEAAGGTLLQTD